MLIFVRITGFVAIFSARVSESRIQSAPISRYKPEIFKAPRLDVCRKEGNPDSFIQCLLMGGRTQVSIPGRQKRRESIRTFILYFPIATCLCTWGDSLL